MRAESLSLRLFVIALIWSLTVLVVGGLLLAQLYRGSVERAFDARLHVYLKQLVAVAAAATEENEVLPGSFGEPRFEVPLSGWYWQIRTIGTERRPIVSPSLWDQVLPVVSDQGVGQTRGFVTEGYIDGPGGQRLRIVERRVDFGPDAVFAMSVAAESSEIESEVSAFVRTLVIALFVLGFGIFLATLAQVRYGLLPLKRISSGLIAVRAGRAARLEGRFPTEIRPLVEELNALISANQEIVERARTHTGNLAHALKTPLAVIANEVRSGEPVSGTKINEQTLIMREQIQRHLERARAAARIAVTDAVCEVEPVVDALLRAMRHIHADKGVRFTSTIPRELTFRGESQDLEEMLGNLVDNAGKWATAQVRIEGQMDRIDPLRPMIILTVEDDGQGMTATQREAALRRGQRLDETKPGSGLGLSIVTELATTYGGRLSLSTASTGGLRADLVLPAGVTYPVEQTG